MCTRGNHQRLCIDEQVEILIGFTICLECCLVFACRQDTLLGASSHDYTCRVLPFKQVSNPIRVHVHLEVLADQLNGFFVSGPVITQQTLVTSALAASAPLPCLPCFCSVLLC